jgi:hypothetical protein
MTWSYLGFLYGRYPRKISLPEQFVVNSLEEFTAALEKYRANTRVGATIYTTDENPAIDRVVFDFDTETALEDVKKLHKECRRKNPSAPAAREGCHDGSGWAYPKSSPRAARTVIMAASMHIVARARLIKKGLLGHESRAQIHYPLPLRVWCFYSVAPAARVPFIVAHLYTRA